MHQIAPGQLVAGDIPQGPAPVDVQGLESPADPQNGPPGPGKGVDQKGLRSRKGAPDVPAAGQQQSPAVQTAVQVPAQDYPDPGALQCRQIVFILK